MTGFKAFTIAALIAATNLVHAESQPNVNPGLWEFTTITKLKDAPALEPSEQTFQECLTEADIISQKAIVGGIEECEVYEQSINRDGMRSSLTCPAEDNQEVEVNTQMRFLGDSVEGQIISGVITRIGPFEIIIDVTGRRIEEC